jgi:hypothetical protein
MSPQDFAWAATLIGAVSAVWLDARHERWKLHQEHRKERDALLRQLDAKDERTLAIALGRDQKEMEDARKVETALRRFAKNVRRE